MRTTSIRELHLRTGAIVDEAAKGKVIVIARRGKPVAEIRPIHPIQRKTPAQMVKDLEPLLAKLPKMKTDTGRFISEDRDRVVSARAAGFSEIWSNDRHLLRAARHFGLKGRSV